MTDYDFRSLSPIDFEILARDLLQEEFKVRVECFKTGQDQGIDMSFEARVSFVASVATQLNIENSKKFLDEMLLIVQELIESKSASRKDLVQLLIELKDQEFIFKDQKLAILEKAKFFLMCKPNWIEDFEPFCDFIESFPELVTASEKAAIRKDCKSLVKNETYFMMKG